MLRIEDTDVQRSEERYEARLIEDLRWFGLDWDEGPDKGGPFGPYRQSERKETYSRFTRELIEHSRAYYCFCSPEQLEAERQEALKAGRQPRYSGRCRSLSREESVRRAAAGEPAAVRLKIQEGAFAWDDLVHGPTSFPGEVIGDPVLVRSDGNPAYNYAVVIDDHLMEITHVIRGDDHISNTPRQLAVYRALEWAPPAFGHLSTILGQDRTRLSKRHGATSLDSFREMGILPEALRNYLALLGWSPADGKTEILSDAELIAQFSLDHIIRSSAVFDTVKLSWLNRHYMKASPTSRLATLSVPYLVQSGYLSKGKGISPPVLKWLERVVEAVLKNLDTLSELGKDSRQAAPQTVGQIGARDVTGVIFEYDPKLWEHDPELYEEPFLEQDSVRKVLAAFIPKALASNDFNYQKFREITKAVQKETGYKGRDLFHPIRVALTGKASGPELEKLIPIIEEGAKLSAAEDTRQFFPHPVLSCAERLREFQEIAKIL